MSGGRTPSPDEDTVEILGENPIPPKVPLAIVDLTLTSESEEEEEGQSHRTPFTFTLPFPVKAESGVEKEQELLSQAGALSLHAKFGLGSSLETLTLPSAAQSLAAERNGG
jgi:hypothetical protein